MVRLGVIGGILAACSAVPSAPLKPRARPAADVVRKAERERRSGAFAQARRSYEAALARDAGDTEAHVGVQVVALKHGRDLELRRRYRAPGTDPYLRARLEPAGRRQREALRDAEEPWRSFGRGDSAAGTGESFEALRQFRRAAALDPGHPWMRIGVGRTALARGALGEAEAAFCAGLWADPAHPAPPLGLSAIADRRGDLMEAYGWAVEAFRRAPAEEFVATRLARLAMRSRRSRTRREAADLLERYGKRGHDHALLWSARLWREVGERGRAEAALRRARALGATEQEVAAARSEPVRGPFRSFVRALVAGVHARYRHYAATREAEGFDEFVRWARAVYEREMKTTLGPPAEPVDYAFVGTLVDPTLDSREPLVRACAERGFVLVLGRRRGGPPEALLAEVVRREPASAVTLRGITVEREVIWTGRRHLSGYPEWAGTGDLAGVALERAILVDLHAVARWEGQIRRRLRRLEPGRNALLAAPALEDEPVTAVDDPAGVAERLYLAATIDVAEEVRVHEDGHLVDAARHLPVERHALRNLGLALRRGFSASEILAFLERNAQLTAIAEGPSPRAALATCCALLGGGGAHAHGYREIVQFFVNAIAARPALYPEIDTSRVIVQQLHRLPDGKIRALARRMLE